MKYMWGNNDNINSNKAFIKMLLYKDVPQECYFQFQSKVDHKQNILSNDFFRI